MLTNQPLRMLPGSLTLLFMSMHHQHLYFECCFTAKKNKTKQKMNPCLGSFWKSWT